MDEELFYDKVEDPDGKDVLATRPLQEQAVLGVRKCWNKEVSWESQ